MEWTCETCDKPTKHDLEYIAEGADRPKLYLSAKLTCSVCETVGWATDDIFDAHACEGSGEWCYCNDTRHQHCTQCDAICSTDPSFEP